MPWSTLFYPITLALGYGLIYLVLFFCLPHFFNQKKARLSARSFFSISILIFLSLLIWQGYVAIANEWLANRLLHAVGGGVLASLAVFLATKDSHVKITRFQFFTSAILIVTALGVANELAEFFLQEVTGEVFASTITDTWLDLLSNTLGALAATSLFTPFIKKYSK